MLEVDQKYFLTYSTVPLNRPGLQELHHQMEQKFLNLGNHFIEEYTSSSPCYETIEEIFTLLDWIHQLLTELDRRLNVVKIARCSRCLIQHLTSDFPEAGAHMAAAPPASSFERWLRQKCFFLDGLKLLYWPCTKKLTHIWFQQQSLSSMLMDTVRKYFQVSSSKQQTSSTSLDELNYAGGKEDARVLSMTINCLLRCRSVFETHHMIFPSCRISSGS